MGVIEEKFIDSEMFLKLRHRSHTMAKMVEHVESSHLDYIIETGTAYIKDCWGGHGQSTLVWDWLVGELQPERDLRVISIDMNREGIDNAREQTKFVSFVCGDSVTVLNDLPDEKLRKCALLYLDSYDWQPETALESSFHHLAELAAVWSGLPSGCMIAVDDRHSADRGKHLFVAQFMEKLRIKPRFAAYQIAWIKP